MLLMYGFPSVASGSVLILSNSCIGVPQLSSVCKDDLKIIQSLLERVQIHKNAGKPKNLWELKDFSEEQQEI